VNWRLSPARRDGGRPGDEDTFRVVRQDERGNVVGAVELRLEDGDVVVEIRRYDEAVFGSVRVVIP
jgi:hypothetical protein